MRRHNWGVGEVKFLYFRPVAKLSTPTVILLFCLKIYCAPSFYVQLFYWRLRQKNYFIEGPINLCLVKATIYKIE